MIFPRFYSPFYRNYNYFSPPYNSHNIKDVNHSQCENSSFSEKSSLQDSVSTVDNPKEENFFDDDLLIILVLLFLLFEESSDYYLLISLVLLLLD